MSIDLATLDREDGFKLGLCYFDPTSESLYEISQESGYMLSADSYRSVVHKVYVVTGTETPMTSLVVKPIRSPEVEDIFDIKVATGPVQPSMMTFEELPSYNTLRIDGPIIPNSLVPVFVYIKANSDITSISGFPVEVSYEHN